MKITYNSTRIKQQNVYYCLLHFSASSPSEVSLTLVPVGGCRLEFGHATRWVQIRIGICKRIHSVPLATRQAETVGLFAVFADLKLS